MSFFKGKYAAFATRGAVRVARIGAVAFIGTTVVNHYATVEKEIEPVVEDTYWKYVPSMLYPYATVKKEIEPVVEDSYWKYMPSKGTVAVVAAGATIAVVGATVLVPAIGFTAAGVKAGTLAAAAHSAIGDVAAGSAFAYLQSAGVLGLGATTKAGVGVAGGGIGGYLKKKFEGDIEKEKESPAKKSFWQNMRLVFTYFQSAGVLGLLGAAKAGVVGGGIGADLKKEKKIEGDIEKEKESPAEKSFWQRMRGK